MNRILVAVSPSDSSTAVIARAIELARATNGKVRLLTAVPDVATSAPLGRSMNSATATARLVEIAEAALRSVLATVPEGLQDGILVEVGTPANVICNAAQSCDADLVVIGAHEHRSLDRVLGTTAGSVVNRIDRPVFVVRDRSAPTSPDSKAHHSFLEAVGVAGVATGAVTGALLGPPGVVVGGLVGGAIGAIVGHALDADAERVSHHDRDLDADIGVSGGDIGSRDRAVASANALEVQTRNGNAIVDGSLVARASDLLRTDHTRLETVYSAFLSAYRQGDWADVGEQWKVFASALRTHMADEEAQLFPEFGIVDPEETTALLADHKELRRLLDELGVGVDRHVVSLATAVEFVGRLRSHATREEMLLYPWLDDTAKRSAPEANPAGAGPGIQGSKASSRARP